MRNDPDPQIHRVERPRRAPAAEQQSAGRAPNYGKHAFSSESILVGLADAAGAPGATSVAEVAPPSDAAGSRDGLERPTGHWQRGDPHGPREPAPLRWEPNRSIRDRIRRGIGVPALAGAAVFATAVAIAIAMTLVSNGGGEAEAVSAESVSGSGAVRASPEPEGAHGAPEPEAPSDASGKRERGAGSRDVGALSHMTVHVVGEVSAAGIVELPPGARLSDAIEAAGGATPAAVLDAVNLARPVTDGEQIVVPDTEMAALWMAQPPGTEASARGPAAAEGSSRPNGSSGSDSVPGSPNSPGAATVSLNSATVADLETLPRIGPALAQRIIDWRDANGGFTAVDDLLDVSGIGAKTLDGFRDLVAL